jgi:hypothetical protein
MTIIDFYKKLSKILTDTREEFLSRSDAQRKLDWLMDEAQKNDLKVKISNEILDPVFLMRLDDENSFRSPEEDDYSDVDYSYGDDGSF